jgi:hypothetical protein
VSGYRSPRQRRDAHRRRRWQALAEARRARAAAEEALRRQAREDMDAENPRPVTPVSLIAEQYGVDAIPWRVRGGPGAVAVWPGGRVVGTLDAVRAELEHRTARRAPAASGAPR